MMDYEKLIEQLKQKDGLWCSVPTGEKLVTDAAEAFAAQLAENAQLRDELEQAKAEIIRLKYYEDKCHDCPIVCAKTEIIKAHEELEAIQAELEQVKWEKDAAVNDLQCIKSCAVCKHCDSLQTPIPEICKKCSHGENWDWRGPKED